MMKFQRLSILALITILLPYLATASEPSRSDILQALPNGFSYGFSHPHILKNVGTISINKKHYLIVYYDYEETLEEAHKHGGVPHAAHRLIIFRDTRAQLIYLGFYGVDVPPTKISGSKVLFENASEGDEIVFGKDGPPLKILLNGEPRALGR
jgi:hypothetical protein